MFRALYFDHRFAFTLTETKRELAVKNTIKIYAIITGMLIKRNFKLIIYIKMCMSYYNDILIFTFMLFEYIIRITRRKGS